jgi:hypothetical protein
MERLLALFGFTAVSDIAVWRSWLTTRLSALAGAIQLAGGYFVTFPPEWTGAFPIDVGRTLLVIGTVATFLIPIVRGIEQPKLAEKRAIAEMQK